MGVVAGVYKCSTTIIKPVFSEFSCGSSVSFKEYMMLVHNAAQRFDKWAECV